MKFSALSADFDLMAPARRETLAECLTNMLADVHLGH